MTRFQEPGAVRDLAGRGLCSPCHPRESQAEDGVHPQGLGIA
jgi:hypothetical protein